MSAAASQGFGVRRILVVGNGPTGLDSDGAHHVDRTCGEFLIDLTELGYQVTFVQLTEPLAAARNNYGCVLPREKLRGIGIAPDNLWRGLKGAATTLRELFRADLVYLFYPGTLPRWFPPLCRLLRIPYAIYLRGSLPEDDGRDAAIVSRAAFVLTVAPTLLPPAERESPRTSTIRSMCEITADDLVRREFKALDRPVELLFVGQVNRVKGIPDLIDAIGLLGRRGVNYRLTVAGLGNLYPELAKSFPGGPEAQVHMAGMIEDRDALMRAYERSDIFILPTHYEGFPRVLYEAMIKSSVVITTMVSGIPSFMKDGENCLAVPTDDPEAIADSVERLISDPSLMEKLAAAGVDTVLSMLKRPFHVDAFHEQMKALAGSTTCRRAD